MNQSVQKTADYNKDVELIEVVRSCVFKGSTDSELRLFMFKCQEVGVHPLSQMIIPVVYTDSNEQRKVSFISTIDFFRSQSEEAGDYDGIDEIEFIGESSFEFGKETIFHPDEAICRVYRKGISRPFVGKARWSEFYPGEKKGHMWRKMPSIMLGKCAEAQARRLAWPKNFNKIYSEEEMDRGFAALADGYTSKKPNVTPADVHVSDAPKTDYSSDLNELRHPSDEERTSKKLISEKQAYLMLKSCQEMGVDIGSIAKAANVENIFFLTWNNRVKTNFNAMLKVVKEKPNSFAKFTEAAQTAKEAPTSPPKDDTPNVMGADEFSSIVSSMALQAGIPLEEGLKECVGVDHPDDVLPEDQSKVIDYFESKSETAGA